tara:strand:+ start:14638 stop:16398 length:1761 start_codon:yes stop_codon:yes gene_type:complete
MAKQQTRTSGGAYQNPTEGIVDYGAFGRGIEKGIKPGLDFLKAEEKRKKEEEPTYDNVAPPDVNAIYSDGGDLGLTEGASAEITAGLKRKAEGLRVRTDKKTGKKTIINFNDKNSNATKEAELLFKTGKGINILFKSGLENSEVVDFLHQAPVIGENKKTGKKITYNSILNTNFQKEIKGAKGAGFDVEFREVEGIMTGGLVIDGYFIRTDDLTPETITKWLPPKDNTDSKINDHFLKTGKNIKLTTETKKEQETTVKNGIETTEIKDKSIITEDSYTSIDRITLDAANKIIRDSNTTFNAIYRNILYGVGSKKSDTSYINSPKFKDGFTYAGETYNVEEFFKINEENNTLGTVPDEVKKALAIQYTQDKYRANQFPNAYISDKYGHNKKTRDLVNETTRTTEKAPTVEEPSEMQKSISLNIKNSLTGSALDVKNNLFSGDPIAVTFAPNVFAKISFKDLTSKPGSSALSSDLTGGKKLESLEFAIGNIEDAEGKSIDAKTVTYDFSLLDKTDVGKSGKFSLEHYLLDKYGKGYEAFVQKKINKEKQKRRIFFVNEWQENNKKGTYSQGVKAYESLRGKQLAELKK